MIHPIKSLIARRQSYQNKFFHKTSYGNKLRALKNIHLGETCFIIGNGPSLKIEDLDVIDSLGLPSFAFNRVFCVFDEVNWRPTYYISQDENVTYGMKEEFEKLDFKYRFHPIRWKWYKNLDFKGSYYFKLVHDEDDYFNEFSLDFSSSVVDSATVAYTAFQLAYYMGFKKIYLIGFDQNYNKTIDNDGNIVIDEKVEKSYFSDKYLREKSDDLLLPNIYKMNKAFISVAHHIEQGKIDLEVYNATRGGMLEVFPRVDLDKIFEELKEQRK